MFHIADNLYFGRLSNGDVRILKFRYYPPQCPDVTRNYPSDSLEFDTTIPAGAWPSVVTSVSCRGNDGGRFYEAQAFHMNPPQAPVKQTDPFGKNF